MIALEVGQPGLSGVDPVQDSCTPERQAGSGEWMGGEQEESGPGPQARTWVVRLASGNMTDGDLTALYAWLGESVAHASAFEAERAFWQRLGPLQATFERLERDEAVPSIHVPRLRRQRLRQAFVALAALAACLLLLALAPELSLALRADYRSGPNGTLQVTLADGSRVLLDRNSALAVDFSADERRVALLEGEAFFEVTRDAARPFRVGAAEGVSEAVGTAFAVRLEEGGARVAVTEGRVAVSAGPARQLLAAGKALSYGGTGRFGPPVTLDAARALAWRQGRMVLLSRPLPQALAELERYHAGRIILLADARALAPVTGVIDLDRLDEGIAALAATHGLAAHRLTPFLTVLR